MDSELSDDAKIRLGMLLIAWEQYTKDVLMEMAEISHPADPLARLSFYQKAKSITGVR